MLSRSYVTIRKIALFQTGELFNFIQINLGIHQRGACGLCDNYGTP